MGWTAIEKLFFYNAWAWHKLFPSLERLDAHQYHLPRPFFWDSLHGLMVHAVTAEWLWRQRLMGVNPSSMLDPSDFSSFPAIWQRWQTEWRAWQSTLKTLQDTSLDKLVPYKTTEGRSHQLPVRDILLHVVNHATEHRSQMTPILAQLGAATDPLDYLYFCLETH